MHVSRYGRIIFMTNNAIAILHSCITVATTEVTTISTTTMASSSSSSVQTMSDTETILDFTETFNGEKCSRYSDTVLILTTTYKSLYY